MDPVDRWDHSQGARPRRWPRALVTAVLAVGLVALVPGLSAAGTGARAKPPKPTATSTPTASSTASASPTPTPTASASPTPTVTASPSPTPTATTSTPPSGCALGTVQHDGTTWCVATVDQVADDIFPSGSPVALVAAPVDWFDGSYVYVTGSADPCPPGYYCGAGVRTAAIDVRGVPSPSVGAVVDAWGTTRLGGILVAAGIAVAP